MNKKNEDLEIKNLLKKLVEKENKKKTRNKDEYYVKYRTLYMKYKHQQNAFDKERQRLKEIIRLLQVEVIKNVDNEDLFKKIEELNCGV